MMPSHASSFRRGDRLLWATFAAVLAMVTLVFWRAWRTEVNDAAQAQAVRFLQDRTRLEFLLQSSTDTLATLHAAVSAHYASLDEPDAGLPPTPIADQLWRTVPAPAYVLVHGPANKPERDSMLTVLPDTPQAPFPSYHRPPRNLFNQELEVSALLHPLALAARSRQPDVSWVYFVGRSGFMHITPPMTDPQGTLRELWGLEFYTRGLPEENPQHTPFWTAAYIDAAGLGMMVTLGKPVYAGTRFVGTMNLDLRLDALNRFVQGRPADQGTLFLVNQHQQLIAHPTLVRSADTKVTPGAAAFPPPLRELAGRALPPGEWIKRDGWWLNSQPLDHAPWVLYLATRGESIERAGLAKLLPIYLTSVGGAAMLFGVAWLLRRRAT